MADLAAVEREVRRLLSRNSGITLLVKLPPRRQQFLGNLLVALGPAGKRLPLERELGRVSLRGIGASAFLHAGVLFVLMLLPGIRRTAPVVAEEKPTDYILIYHTAESLPSMDDTSGVAPAAPSRNKVFRSNQTIQVSQAAPFSPTVVDPLKLRLPATDTTASLLALPSLPSPPSPVLAAPVELVRTESKIAWPDRRHEPAAVDTSHLQLTPGTVSDPSHSSASLLAKLASESKIVLENAPRLAIPKPSKVDVSGNPTPDLQMVPLTSVPALPAAESNNQGDAPSVTPQQVVIAVNPGDSLGVPRDAKPASLAFSPKGHTQPGTGEPDGENSTAGGSAASGGTPAAGTSSIGRGNPPAIPGVVVRGGVVSLDSFGPRAVPRQKAAATVAESARKAAPITVIATSRSGGGLNAYGVFKNRTVYTIYIDTAAGRVVFQFAAQSSTAAYNASLTPPDPLLTDMPAAHGGLGVVFSGVLDTAGHLQNLRVMEGAAPSQAIEDALRRWRFHPVLDGGQPVAVDALIGIGMGVH